MATYSLSKMILLKEYQLLNGGLQKAPMLCNPKASKIRIELQNYWRSVEMRTDTLKKESHIAFRHPISSFTPYSEKERGGKH